MGYSKADQGTSGMHASSRYSHTLTTLEAKDVCSRVNRVSFYLSTDHLRDRNSPWTGHQSNLGHTSIDVSTESNMCVLELVESLASSD